MPSIKYSKNNKAERQKDSDTLKASKGRGGKYTKVGPVSHHVADFYHSSSVNRQPTMIRRAEPVPSSHDRSTRSLSVPSLHSTDARSKYSPPLSPPKARSRSVRDPNTATKKSHSFRRALKQMFGSHSELENGGGLWAMDGQQTVGTYRPLNFIRPKSMGESSDCSNSSALSRENSLRDSMRSRVRDGVFYPGRQPSIDSNDADSLKPLLPRADMTRSNSSASLKNFHAKPLTTDTKHFSIAGMPSSYEENYYRSVKPRHIVRQGTSEEAPEWEDTNSFQFVCNAPVLPSHPEYGQVARDLMSVSPSKLVDPRRMSDASVDPRRVSTDSGVESLAASKHHRSLPTTPIAPYTGHNGSPEFTPHGYTFQDGSELQRSYWTKDQPEEDESMELPAGWELVKSPEYGTYYVNHNNKTAMYRHPHILPRPHSVNEERRRAPGRSHSHRSTASHRVLDSRDSLPRRSKSFRDQEVMEESHERQLSTMTFVPPSPYQIKEIPPWVKEYVEKPFGSESVLKLQSQWPLYSLEQLTEVDTMVKRLFKKASEQVVRNCEYYRVAIQQEIDYRNRLRMKYSQPFSPRDGSFRYPSPQPSGNPYPGQNGTIKPRLSKNEFQTLDETFV